MKTFYARITTEDKKIFYYSVKDINLEEATEQVDLICYYMFGRLPEKAIVKEEDCNLSNRTKELLSKHLLSIDKQTLIISGTMLDQYTYISKKYNYTEKI